MIASKYYNLHTKLTEMQLRILKEIRLVYPRYDGIITSDLLDLLDSQYTENKRAWQGSLKGLGKKGYISYGNGHVSCDNGVIILDIAKDYFENYLV